MAASTTALVIASAGTVSMAVSEGSSWSLSNPAVTTNQVSLLAQGRSSCTPSFTLPPSPVPPLEFRPARGRRTAVLEVPATLEGLTPHELHGAVAIKRLKDGPPLVARKRQRPRAVAGRGSQRPRKKFSTPVSKNGSSLRPMG